MSWLVHRSIGCVIENQCRSNYVLLIVLVSLSWSKLYFIFDISAILTWNIWDDRTCVEQCEEIGSVGDISVAHCQFSPDVAHAKSTWYTQEPLYMQWKQLNCRSECRYHCMMQREKEREATGRTPVKYHGKWPLKRIFVFQVCCYLYLLVKLHSKFVIWLLFRTPLCMSIWIILFPVGNAIYSQEPISAALSALNLLMHFIGWLSFFSLVCYKLPSRSQTKRPYYEYTGLLHIYGLLSMHACLWSTIFHTL